MSLPRLWETGQAEGAPPILRTWAVIPMLVLTVVALGVNWPFLTIAIPDTGPLWLSTYRLAGSALAIGLVVGARGRLHLPSPADRPLVAVVGVGRMILVMSMVLFALSLVPPGRSSILVYTSALWTVPVAGWMLGEQITRLRAAGLAIGVAGLAVLLDPTRMDWTDPGTVVGHLLLLGAAWIMAYVMVRIRGHRWTSSPLELLFWQVAIAVPVVGGLAAVAEGAPSFDWSVRTWLIVVYQGTMATPFAVWATHHVLRKVAAGTTNLVLNLVPVVGILSSVWLVGEALTTRSAVAVTLIVAGVWVGVALDGRRGLPPDGQQCIDAARAGRSPEQTGLRRRGRGAARG